MLINKTTILSQSLSPSPAFDFVQHSLRFLALDDLVNLHVIICAASFIEGCFLVHEELIDVLKGSSTGFLDEEVN